MRLRLTILGAVLARTAGMCADFCMHDCAELNGNVEAECGTCTATSGCHPGTAAYQNHPKRPSAGAGSCSAEQEQDGQSCTSPSVREAGQTKKKKFDGDELAERYERGKRPGLNEGDYNYNVPKLEYSWLFDNRARREEEESAVAPSSGCDLAVIDHSEMNRTWLLDQRQPLIIRGVTESWLARQRWGREEILEARGEEPFHMGVDATDSLASLLKKRGRYFLGHIVFPRDDCYMEVARPYSPFLATVADEFEVPDYLQPMRTFQMGIGDGHGVGVAPEEHPSSWFAMIKGLKRWVVHPPNKVPPPRMMTRQCELLVQANTTQICDQREGEVLWLPHGWWHETCGLEGFSVGIGGITYKGATDSAGPRPCVNDGEYKIGDIPYCQSNHCPDISHACAAQATAEAEGKLHL